MTTPLSNIKDIQQLNYVFEAIARAEYELTIARHRVMFLFPDAKAARNALTFAREPLQKFMCDYRRIIDGSELDKEMGR